MNWLSRQQIGNPVVSTESASSATASNLAVLAADHEQQLAQLADLLAAMTPSQYRHSPSPNESLGAHVRHVLEHYDCLFNDQDGLIDYDQRPRDFGLESCVETALERLNRLRAALRRLESQPVRIRHRPAAGATQSAILIESNIERELLFLVSHTIHHMAMISLHASRAGLQVTPGFGVMPSTLRHREIKAAAVTEES